MGPFYENPMPKLNPIPISSQPASVGPGISIFHVTLESSVNASHITALHFLLIFLPYSVALYRNDSASQGHLVMSGDIWSSSNPISIYCIGSRAALTIPQGTGPSPVHRMIQPQISVVLRLTDPIPNPGNFIIALTSPEATARFLNVFGCMCMSCFLVLMGKLKLRKGNRGREGSRV